MQVFLTGGTGFIGRPLSRRLRQRGWSIRVLVRKPSSPEAQEIQRTGVELLQGDVTDRESMRAGMAGADLVVHNAAWFEVGVTAEAAQRMRAINVQGTEHVLGLAQELGVPRVVYTSSVAAFGETGRVRRDETFVRQVPPRSAYEQSKTDAHQVALRYQAAGLPLVIGCPGSVIGPNDHSGWGYFARLYVNGWMPPIAWAKDAYTAQVGVEDVAEALVLLAEKGRPGEVYFLVSQSLTIGEVMAVWRTTPGGFAVRAYAPTGLTAALAGLAEPLQRAVGLPAFLSRETVYGSATNYYYDNAKARRELGWNPQPVRELWLDTLREERALRAKRNGGDLVARLKPLPAGASA